MRHCKCSISFGLKIVLLAERFKNVVPNDSLENRSTSCSQVNFPDRHRFLQHRAHYHGYQDDSAFRSGGDTFFLNKHVYVDFPLLPPKVIVGAGSSSTKDRLEK